MANLLDQASIVLTPTAYDNGKVLCAKPSEAPYGDFDFSRNSAATRVNAQGLVENVQILSSNLVQNGDFSEEGVQEVSNGSFSQEGVEEVTNGDFSSDTAWIKATGWTISGGKANFNGTSNSNLQQNNVTEQNKIYKVSFEVSDYVSGTVQVIIGDNLAGEDFTFSSNGVFVFYTTADSGTTQIVRFRPTTSAEFSIDNVSVREVGQDWALGTGWSIGEDKAVANTTGDFVNLYQNSVFVVGKTYKTTFTIVDYTQGSVRLTQGGIDVSGFQNAVGTYTTYFTATQTSLYMQGYQSFIGSITNISVKEVGMDWSINNGGAGATTNITLGALNIVTDGDFTNAEQNGFLTSGNNYSLTYTIISNSVVGVLQATLGTASVSVTVPSTVGTHSIEFTAAGSAAFAFKRGGGALNVSITNISVIEITTDTNLPRINYEGFSYQDALGSELVTNGDFATDSGWNKNSNWTISGGVAIADGSSDLDINQGTTLATIGKSYEISYEVVSISQGGFFFKFGGVNSVPKYSVGVYTEIIQAVNTNRIALDSENNAIGSIDNVSVKEYLGQEVVPNSGCGSWLWEPQSTNLSTRSNELNLWATKIGVAITANYSLSPNGSINSNRLLFSANGFCHNGQLQTSGTTYTISAYAKRNSGTENVGFFTNGSGSVNYSFNLTNEWQRFEYTYTSVNTSTFGFAGVSGADISVYGFQIETLPYATSLIPTSGSTVTRNQDLCNNGGSLATINSTEGTLYAEIAALANDLTNRIISITNGASVNGVSLYYSSVSNLIRANYYVGGVAQCNLQYILADETDFGKIAFVWKINRFELWVDGVKRVEDLSGAVNIANTMNDLSFSRLGGNTFFGKTKALAVWKEALSDQELAELTYPTPTDPTFSLDFDTIAEQFTFARGSEATYVDAQGLIQSTNEIGEELVVNGDFATDTNWNKGAGWSIGGGKATSDGTQVSASYLSQTLSGISQGKQYITVFDIDLISGSFRFNTLGGNLIITESGRYVINSTSTSGITLYLEALVGFTGSIDNVSVKEVISATNTPRLDYSTGAEAFLLEPQSTNLITYSEDFSSWNDYKVTLNTTLSPDGNSVLFLDFDNVRMFPTTTISSSTEYTSSIYLKANKVADVKFRNAAEIDTVISLTTNWVRYELTATSTSTSTNALLIDARFSQGLGASGLEIALWGAQLEQQSYTTSYIPTSGSTVTRNQETCINATPEINSEEGTLYFEGSALALAGGDSRISLSNGTLNNRVSFAYSPNPSKAYIIVKMNGISVINELNLEIGSHLENKKIAISYKSGDTKVFLNGTEIKASNMLFSGATLNDLSFESANGSVDFYGNTKDLQVYPKALSDAELINLTTI